VWPNTSWVWQSVQVNVFLLFFPFFFVLKEWVPVFLQKICKKKVSHNENHWKLGTSAFLLLANFRQISTSKIWFRPIQKIFNEKKVQICQFLNKKNSNRQILILG
jgi:hypothetical protein